MVSDVHDYENARDGLRGNLMNGLHYTRSGDYLLEEYLDGPEYSAEVAWNDATKEWDVIAFVRKYTTEGLDFVELGHVCPAPLSADLYATCARAVREWLHAVGLTLSVAHVEFRIVGGEPALIEINARPAGGHIRELVRHVTGFDLVELYANLLLPDEMRSVPNRELGPLRPSAIRFLLPDKSGVPSKLLMSESDRSALIFSGLLRGHKQATRPLMNEDRAAYLMVDAPDPESAWEKATTIASRSRVLIV